MKYPTNKIRNLTFAGHGGTGKTTLFERLLFTAKAIPKAETLESGKTVSDYTAEEIERKISIVAAMAHLDWQGTKINILDTPGSSDFIGDVILCLRSSELAVLAISAKTGAQIETLKLWRNLNERNKPRAIFITKMEEGQPFDDLLVDIKTKLDMDAIPFTLPLFEGEVYKGVIDVLSGKAWLAKNEGLEEESELPAEYADALAAAKETIAEAAAEGDDDLMNKYLEEGELSDDEILVGLQKALQENKILPLFCGSALQNSGLHSFLNFVVQAGPDPTSAYELVVDKEGQTSKVMIDSEKPLAAIVVKTQYDQFSGKLSWVKVINGTLTSESDIYNVKEGKKERVGKMYVATGKKLDEVKELAAGDIGIVQKIVSLKTSDSITTANNQMTFVDLRLPTPVHSLAVNAEQKKDEDKLGESLIRVSEEDNTFQYKYNVETKETIIKGMGELHINIILDRIKKNQKIEVTTKVPRVAYRETIAGKAAAEYTHKKQSGGHGQYGRVALELSPLPRGEKYSFINAIVGGAIPKSYMPGVEKGVQEAMQAGVLAGYPVVDVESKIVDGKEHPVDSSEMAFKIAARNAFRQAMRDAKPSLLEPILRLTVFVEDKYLGDIMSDLSGRRGKILGQESAGGDIDEIKALVPESELLRYSIDLRAMTSGTGSFAIEFDHYEPLSGKLAEDIIKAAQDNLRPDEDD